MMSSVRKSQAHALKCCKVKMNVMVISYKITDHICITTEELSSEL